jgi:hypothetical protein
MMVAVHTVPTNVAGWSAAVPLDSVVVGARSAVFLTAVGTPNSCKHKQQ